ncbi:MAG: hypothetical protein ACRBBW_00650 [Cellvibrionaceae bacterium]
MQTEKYSFTLFLVGALLALSLNTTVTAEDEESVNAKQSATIESDKNESKTPVADADKANETQNKDVTNTDERFIPTEEISEDLPVSFPVDI